ncbi:DUF4352 domain-containing protein [Listeria booriae]|uniref:DUF4352 domain-containing protein n=1 Tax=Listeria booriae TaxID=1552123 RepID=A0A842AVL7_9LIST|nr:DUF4352 domain-containing protein [Listeria booriae]MBC1795786.1 DUF4352 domain-containing protein [Listeria booriae]MBC1800101.1 DUF4352 domain-containing protein [Listeria booriae]MBC1813605.1 DUF4352 domain-containing protein [Listeria booriae]MDT0111246.1 DUF4352 domain-containing protein [Listeria booriae]
MKKYQKAIIATATVLTLATTAVGCSSPKADDSNKTTQQTQTDIGKKKVIADIEMTPKNFTYKQDDTFNEKGKELTVIPMHIANKTKSEFGVGAGDFHLETADGKKIDTFGYHDSFGDVIPAGKTLDGNAYFAIPKNGKDYTLVYHPAKAASEQTLKWTIGSPKK